MRVRSAAAGAALALASLLPSSGQAQQAPAKAETSALPPSPPSPDIGIARDGLAAYRRGDIPGGDALRARAATDGGRALLDWAAIRFGGSAVPLERIAAFRSAYPDFPGRAWLRRREEEALVAERRPASSVRAFFAREKPQTPGGKLALAQAFAAEGLDDDALSTVRELWRTDTFGRELESKILDAFGDKLTVADHRLRMERFLLRENWDTARRAAGYAGKDHETLVKARIAVEERSAKAPKLLDAVPAALKSDPSWLFSRVQNLRRTEKAAEAAKILTEVTRDPALLADGDAWWVERRLVARKLLDEGDAKTAYTVLAGHGAATGDKRTEAEFTAGWLALRFLEDPVRAKEHLARAAALSTGPITRARAAYWLGRAAEASGDPAGAKAHYGEAATRGATYYGQLAAAKLGSAAPPAGPLGDLGASGSTAPRPPSVQALGLAYAAGLRELVLPLAAEFGRGGADVPVLEAAAAVAAENGDPRALLALGKGAVGRGLPLESAAFPTGGIPAFEPLGTTVEPAMLHAIARQESAFDPAAGSGAGARGLMQLMPGTALATARKAGVPYQAGRLLEAAYNAQLGAAHLRDLMDDWKGSLILVFAAYNAGAGNVKKWIAAYGDPRSPEVDAVDWVERIPFSETRAYVQRVMENLHVYRRRLGDPAGERPAAMAASTASQTVATP